MASYETGRLIFQSPCPSMVSHGLQWQLAHGFPCLPTICASSSYLGRGAASATPRPLPIYGVRWFPMVSNGSPRIIKQAHGFPCLPTICSTSSYFGARSSKRHSEAPALRLQTTADLHRLSPKRNVHRTIPIACHASRHLTLFGVYAGIIEPRF